MRASHPTSRPLRPAPRTAPPPRPRRAPARRRPPTPARAADDYLPSDGEVLSTRRLLPSSSVAYEGVRALVVGGSGRTGRLIVQRLLDEGVPTAVLARDPAAARRVLPAGVEAIVKGDVTKPSSLAAAVAGRTVVVWAAGVASPKALLNPFAAPSVEADGVANLAAVARAAGVRRFVLVSSAGADDPVARLTFPGGVLFWKKRGELALQRSGVPYTIIRPGGLTDRALKEGEAVVAYGPGGIGFGPGKAFPGGSIPRAAVADLAVAALVTPAAMDRVVEIVARKGAAAVAAPDLFSVEQA